MSHCDPLERLIELDAVLDMSPAMFLAKAKKAKRGLCENAVERYRGCIKRGERVGQAFLRVKRVKGEVRVVGHNGRHRSRAALLEGVKSVPVKIKGDLRAGELGDVKDWVRQG